MKVDSKHIIPFIENIKALLSDIQYGFAECEDKEQCVDSFDLVYEQLKDIIKGFKVEHLIPVLKSNSSNLPSFVRSYEAVLNENAGKVLACNLTQSEEKMEFMHRFYFAIKRKLIVDDVDHLFTRDKIETHIYNYLVYNDEKWNYYFNTVMAEPAHQVIETVIDEIITLRKKHPQITLNLNIVEPVKTKRLVDIL